MPEKDYYWTVIYRNDRMGFSKTFKVIAPTALWAINESGAVLMGEGYEETIEDFYVTMVGRGREVGT